MDSRNTCRYAPLIFDIAVAVLNFGSLTSIKAQSPLEEIGVKEFLYSDPKVPS